MNQVLTVNDLTGGWNVVIVRTVIRVGEVPTYHNKRARSGFDWIHDPVIARRGWSVGLVKKPPTIPNGNKIVNFVRELFAPATPALAAA